MRNNSIKSDEKGASQPPKTQDRAPNIHDVFIRAIDAFYNLVNSGNFVGFILLGALLLIFFIAWKLPAEYLNGHVGTILSWFSGSKYPIFILTGTLGVSVIGNIIQRKYYKKEIKRLVGVRRKLIHGREGGSMHPLENHYESEFDLDADGE